VAGFSSKVAISEEAREENNYPPSNITSPYGAPWMYVLRDVLQFATNLTDALEIMQNAHRTWSIYVGVGSLLENSFYGFAYAAK